MGFWAALEEVYPETRQQRCWMHKTMSVLIPAQHWQSIRTSGQSAIEPSVPRAAYRVTACYT